jgi:hypothetical protein
MPGFQFLPPAIPFNSHVIHKDHLPEQASLLPELQALIRSGRHGGCCWMASDQWQPTIDMSLALAVWTVSRILTGDKMHGEAASLNRTARDAMLRLREEGKLPLGPALPCPVDGPAAGAAGAPTPGDDLDFEWVKP